MEGSLNLLERSQSLSGHLHYARRTWHRRGREEVDETGEPQVVQEEETQDRPQLLEEEVEQPRADRRRVSRALMTHIEHAFLKVV
ncbi:unnamed protein product [Linum trigynum]|uniref:Uncharacterized protein n=1 Tax=Linum trigynum TaxID=586398 RepID=A0AAV2DFG9_9ROSI